jgi:hypothetical protein
MSSNVELFTAMHPAELKVFLPRSSLSAPEFARLLGVTSRAVTLWLTGERAIPGPVESYIRLFRTLPDNLRAAELARLKARGTGMRDGVFEITFQGSHGNGLGVLVFEDGRIYGSDSERVRYDGTYTYRDNTGRVDVVLKVTFPPAVKSVFGISNAYEWSIDVTTQFDPKQNEGSLVVTTSLGQPINAQFRYLRSLPEAA